MDGQSEPRVARIPHGHVALHVVLVLAATGCFGSSGTADDVPAVGGDAGVASGGADSDAAVGAGGGSGGNAASARADAGADPGGGNGGSSGGGGVMPVAGAGATTGGAGVGSDCTPQVVTASASPPPTYFVVDGSGSMCETFGNSTRWQALRAALLDPSSGLIYALEDSVDFGLVVYDGTIDALLALTGVGVSSGPACAAEYMSTKASGECPLLFTVSAARGNAVAIDASFPSTELGGSTPTDKALAYLVDQLIGQGTGTAGALSAHIVLVTDGLPNDICIGGTGDSALAQQNVVQQVDRAAAANIKTSVIGFAASDPALEAHLAQVAARGDPSNPGARAFITTSPEDLRAALQSVVASAGASCRLMLDHPVQPGRECTGRVQLNGNDLACCVELGGDFSCDGSPTTQPHGWRLAAPDAIELLGQSCVDFLAAGDSLLRVDFPCSSL